MSAQGEAVSLAIATNTDTSLDEVFAAHYARIVRVIARVVRDGGRAEELAVDVFVKWWHHAEARGDGAAGWLCRTAVRMALDELRREIRRSRYERLAGLLRHTPLTPEELHTASDERLRVRTVLARLRRRDAALLLLRADGLSYEQLAAALCANPASIGTLVSRAQRAFHKEYIKRYGAH
jgi:RNA polymerase sigma-70 factor (ECF subfamily)